jgi:16S rRNA (uracil1498-N3)-methyltransferase
VNIVLLKAHEIAADGSCTLHDRRAEHLRTVLKVEPSDTVRIGVLNGALGNASVTTTSAQHVSLSVQLEQVPPPVRDVLLLAAPRPKVLLRMLSHAAALGFARIILFRCWRVDKAWMQSKAFDIDVQHEHLMLGLEQAGRTQLPEVLRYDLFKPMMEDSLGKLDLPQLRFIAHPRAATHTAQIGSLRSNTISKPAICLAIGPDGGFLPYEVEKFRDLSFHAISCGPHPLRTETALAVIWAQLDLLRQRS